MSAWVAALIGAVIGSLGGQVVAGLYDRRKTVSANRRLTVSRYLVQLQDATESLAARARNIARRGGMSATDRDYYQITTIFAIAQFLAHKRRLVVDGAYSQILEFNRELGLRLEATLESVESVLGNPTSHGTSLQRYDRLALAEAVLVRTQTGMMASGYTEFISAWNDDQSQLRNRFALVRKFVGEWDEGFSERLREALDEVGELVGNGTDLTYAYKGRGVPVGE